MPYITQDGYKTFHLVSAATTNPSVIKNQPGRVLGWYIYNNNAAAMKVAFHNLASAPTAGANVLMSLIIPPTSGANVSLPEGIKFSVGIGLTTTAGIADADATAVGLNDLNINIFYE